MEQSIINVIEIIGGIPCTPKSFISNNNNKEERDIILKKATRLFTTTARENGFAGDVEDILEAGIYAAGDNYEIILIWSKVMN